MPRLAGVEIAQRTARDDRYSSITRRASEASFMVKYLVRSPFPVPEASQTCSNVLKDNSLLWALSSLPPPPLPRLQFLPRQLTDMHAFRVSNNYVTEPHTLSRSSHRYCSEFYLVLLRGACLPGNMEAWISHVHLNPNRARRLDAEQ
jgi:hypothetical protein